MRTTHLALSSNAHITLYEVRHNWKSIRPRAIFHIFSYVKRTRSSKDPRGRPLSVGPQFADAGSEKRPCLQIRIGCERCVDVRDKHGPLPASVQHARGLLGPFEDSARLNPWWRSVTAATRQQPHRPASYWCFESLQSRLYRSHPLFSPYLSQNRIAMRSCIVSG